MLKALFVRNLLILSLTLVPTLVQAESLPFRLFGTLSNTSALTNVKITFIVGYESYNFNTIFCVGLEGERPYREKSYLNASQEPGNYLFQPVYRIDEFGFCKYRLTYSVINVRAVAPDFGLIGTSFHIFYTRGPQAGPALATVKEIRCKQQPQQYHITCMAVLAGGAKVPLEEVRLPSVDELLDQERQGKVPGYRIDLSFVDEF
jgi:hypothetical protein